MVAVVTRRRRTFAWLALVLAILLAPTGCAWRRGGHEHYVGPLVFRHREPPVAEARITDIVRFGVLFEGGDQWGLAVGATRRLVAAPIDVCEKPGAAAPLRSSALLAAGGEGWRFSPFYLRIQNAPPATFVSRTSYGAELTAGPEVAALSIGATSRTLLTPPADSLSRFVYDAAHPLATRFSACRDVSDRPLPLTPFER
jgi:hypothetical protein